MYKERFWAGLSYASNDVAGLMAGFDIMGMFRVGYSIDYFMLKSGKNNASHKIILALMVK